MPQGCEPQLHALPLDLDLTPIERKPIRLAAATLHAASSISFAAGRAATEPLASIVVVTFNNLPFTRMCLASVLTNTESPAIEVVVVDNASTDETQAFLAELSQRDQRVQVICNPDNRGFAAANNQGLAAARGEILVLLNNDTIVPPGWLGRLTRHLKYPEIGLVGPVTNRIGNTAEIKTNYSTYGQMLAFAGGRSGHANDIDTLCMFCLAMRRETFETIGQLDERFGVGMFEDDDYSIRAQEAGYRVVCAEDCFVHHFGQASFGVLAAAGEYGQLFEANRKLFEAKWSRVWRSHDMRVDASYRSAAHQLRVAVRENTEPGTTVLVISKGDNSLLDLGDRNAKHFPHAADGSYAGFHPATGREALAALRAVDAAYLVVPATAAWWLEHYRELADHLQDRRTYQDESCQIFALTPQPATTGGRA